MGPALPHLLLLAGCHTCLTLMNMEVFPCGLLPMLPVITSALRTHERNAGTLPASTCKRGNGLLVIKSGSSLGDTV